MSEVTYSDLRSMTDAALTRQIAELQAALNDASEQYQKVKNEFPGSDLVKQALKQVRLYENGIQVFRDECIRRKATAGIDFDNYISVQDALTVARKSLNYWIKEENPRHQQVIDIVAEIEFLNKLLDILSYRDIEQ